VDTVKGVPQDVHLDPLLCPPPLGHSSWERSGTRSWFSFVPYWSEVPCPDSAPRSSVSFTSVTIAPEFVLPPPTSPGFYPHSEWAASGPVQFGVRFQAQARHDGDGPGLLGAAI
jgi:hypothetical protein